MRALSLEYHDVVAGDDPDATGFPGAGPASYKMPLAAFEAPSRRHRRTAARTAPTRATDWLAAADAGAAAVHHLRRRRRQRRRAASPTRSSAAAGAATSS